MKKSLGFAAGVVGGNCFARMVCVALLALLGFGCAPKAPKSFVFYPPPPDPARIQFLTTFNSADELGSGSFTKAFVGDYEREIEKPMGLQFFGDQLLVTNAGQRAQGYVVFDLVNGKSKSVHLPMKKPVDITVDEAGYRYVSDMLAQKIFVYSPADVLTREIKPTSGNFSPAGTLVHGERLYVADVRNNRVVVFDRLSGEQLFEFASNDMNWPTDIDLDRKNSRLAVSETGSNRISYYSLDGEYLKSFGSVGDGPGNFVRSKTIVIDDEGRLLVVDSSFQNIQMFNDEGQILTFFPRDVIRAPENLVVPYGVAISDSVPPVLQRFVAPGFEVEYLIAVTSQGFPGFPAKVSIYALGQKTSSPQPQ